MLQEIMDDFDNHVLMGLSRTVHSLVTVTVNVAQGLSFGRQVKATSMACPAPHVAILHGDGTMTCGT